MQYDAKTIVRHIIEKLPDDCTLEDIIHEIYICASVLESRQQIAAGKGMSLDEAKREMDLWFNSR